MQVHGSMASVVPRARAAISCTECHKRRKRCSEGQPCRNCARRYPPVECIYKPHPKRRPNAAVSTKLAASGQSRSVQPFPQPTIGGSLDEVQDETTSSPQHAQSSVPDRRSGCRAQPLPLECQIPICGLLDKAVEIRAPETSSVDLQKRPQHQPTLPPAFGSGVMDLLPSLEVAPTASNAELFSIYTKVLVPWLFTVDGDPVESPPDNWGSWIPYSIFNPMILYTNLHRAAIWREMVRPTALRLEVNSKDIANYIPDCLALRGKTLTMLRNHLTLPSSIATSDEAISTVACIFFNEWSWSIERGLRDIRPHIKVLREMVNIRGGMCNLGFHAVGLVMIIHYQLAVVLEREPFVFPAKHVKDCFVSGYIPVKSAFDSPLFLSSGTFADKGPGIGLHVITLQILDDMTRLLSKIRSAVLGKAPGTEYKNILKSAAETEGRMKLLRSANEADHPTSNDYIYETCRLAALVYLRAIINQTQFSKAWHGQELQDMFSAITRTPMHHWKPFSGVWLFVVVVINPPRDDIYPGAMFKFFLRTSAFHMAAWDYQCWVNTIESYLALQKWIRSSDEHVDAPRLLAPGAPDIFDVEDLQPDYDVGTVQHC